MEWIPRRSEDYAGGLSPFRFDSHFTDGNRLVDEHDRDVVLDRIEIGSILPDKAAVHFLFHRFPAPIRHPTAPDPSIQFFDDTLVGQVHWLFCLRTGENIQQLFVDHLIPVLCKSSLRK